MKGAPMNREKKSPVVLTDAFAKSITPPQTGQETHYDALVPSFGLRVSAGGAKTWMLQRRVYGQPRRVKIGRYPAVSVAAAREEARRISGLIEAGKDPAPAERDAKMAALEVGEVWGVGRKINAHLTGTGIKTVLDLRRSDPATIRRRFSVVMERTVAELNGVSCLDLEDAAPRKEQILCSRSFGRPVTTLPELKEAVLSYITRAAERMREQESACSQVTVFIHTNFFKEGAKQYSRTAQVPLSVASDDTRRLAAAAVHVLQRIYKPGYEYKKAGVMLTGLQPAAAVQDDLFSGYDRARSTRLMGTLDRINQEYGMGAITFAGAGIRKPWRMLTDNRTPRYTTRWDELAIARA